MGFPINPDNTLDYDNPAPTPTRLTDGAAGYRTSGRTEEIRIPRTQQTVHAFELGDTVFDRVRIFFDGKGNLTVEGGAAILIKPQAANRFTIEFVD